MIQSNLQKVIIILCLKIYELSQLQMILKKLMRLSFTQDLSPTNTTSSLELRVTPVIRLRKLRLYNTACLQIMMKLFMVMIFNFYLICKKQGNTKFVFVVECRVLCICYQEREITHYTLKVYNVNLEDAPVYGDTVFVNFKY